jgi:capsular polysaccharide biosynthesis protein
MSDWQDRPLSMRPLAALLADPAGRAAAGVGAVTTLADGGRYVRRAAEFCDPAAGLGGYRHAYRPLAQDYDPAVVAVLRDAVVVGQGAVVTRDATLIHDSVRAMIGPERVVEGLVDVGGRFHLAPFHLDPSRVVAVPQPALLLQSPWWRNYGHWLFDSAALLALAAGYARRHRLALIIGRHPDPAMRAVAEATMALLLADAEVIFHEDGTALVCEALHYAAPVSVTPLFKQPDALALLRRAVAPAATAPRRRLYVRRPPEAERTLVNEAAVIDLCTARGCEVVEPERLGLRAQAAVFAAAEWVVGVKGAALANLMFAPADATAIVLSPRHWIDPIFWDLAGQRDQRYIEVLADGTDPASAGGGAADPRAPLHVDLAALARALDAAETGQRIPSADPGRGEFALPDMPGRSIATACG